MTQERKRRPVQITTTEEQFLALLDFSRDKRAMQTMGKLHVALLNGEPATEFMDELAGLGRPDTTVQDSFLGGYQIDIVQNECVDHAEWRKVLNGIGIPDARIEQARSLLAKIMATHESIPRRIAAINAICGEDVYVPPSADIIDEVVR